MKTLSLSWQSPLGCAVARDRRDLVLHPDVASPMIDVALRSRFGTPDTAQGQAVRYFGNGPSDSGICRSVISGPNKSCRLSPQPLVRKGSSVAVHSLVVSPWPHHGGPFQHSFAI